MRMSVEQKKMLVDKYLKVVKPIVVELIKGDWPEHAELHAGSKSVSATR
jgi:hypothetical protein